MRIITVFPNNFLWNYTFKDAMANLAIELDFEHYHINMLDNNIVGWIDLTPESKEETIYIYAHNPHLEKWHFDRLKSRIPNSKTVMIGGDCIYFGIDNWPVDIGIEFNRCVVERMNKMYEGKYIHWTPSRNVFHRIHDVLSQTTFKKKYDIICLANMKCSIERIEFINGFCENNKTVLSHLSEPNLDKVIQYYAESKFALGITHSVWGAHGVRSAKGFRDYIAGECGILLIADDYPDITQYSDIIPIYPFNNYIKAIKLMNYYENNLDLYQNLVEKQKNFFYSINMENQLRPILKELLNVK